MKTLITLLLILMVITGCTMSDAGFFGAQYIAADSKYRQYPLHHQYYDEYENNTLVLREWEVDDKYPSYLVRNGRLYLLFWYGKRGKRYFYYPSEKEMRFIGIIFKDVVDYEDPCLGITWLKRNGKRQIRHGDDDISYREMLNNENSYANFVEKSQGGFCDERSRKKTK